MSAREPFPKNQEQSLTELLDDEDSLRLPSHSKESENFDRPGDDESEGRKKPVGKIHAGRKRSTFWRRMFKVGITCVLLFVLYRIQLCLLIFTLTLTAAGTPMDSDIWMSLPARTDGLNVVNNGSAVLIRSQISRDDDRLRKDALLNAREVIEKHPEVKTVYTIFGNGWTPHVYKRVDLQANQISAATFDPNRQPVVTWNAVNDAPLPCYKELPFSFLGTPGDSLHCRHGSMTICGDFVQGGTLELSRSDEEVVNYLWTAPGKVQSK